jgi:ribose transport system substrate-binding protein
VGFAALHGRSEFSRLVREGIEAAAGKRSNIELIVADNKMDRHTTLANMDAFIENKVDLVIEYQHDYSLGTLIGEKLSHASIPVIAVDIPIPGAVYFGAHNYRAGVLGGTAAAEEVRVRWEGAPDNLIVVVDSAAGPLPENRITGMLDAFLNRVPFPRERIIRIESGNDPDVVAAELAAVLSEIPPKARNIVFSMNSYVTEGILRAIATQDRSRNTLVAGHNVTPRIAQELAREDSPLIGSVAFFPEQYGERIMELAERLLERKPVNPDNYTEHKWIGRQKPF